ncbi:hypothetical protein HOD29_02155 [archaeon]|jgi:hypothetical protein|nr:hypothetical protein [archaeon]
MKRVADKRFRSFFKSHLGLVSPRIKYIPSSVLANSIRQHKKGLDSSFISKEMNEFSEGYELIGLNEIKDYSKFFKEKGIHYVNGLLNRIQNSPLNKLNSYSRQARKFKKDYSFSEK